jgi:hypothetical protein
VDASDIVKGYQVGKGEYIEIELSKSLRPSGSKEMRPFPADLMLMWPISSRVSKPENDEADRSGNVGWTAHSPLGRPRFCKLLADAGAPLADERRLALANSFSLMHLNSGHNKRVNSS